MRTPRVLLIGLAALALTACGPDESASDSTPAATTSVSPSTGPSGSASPLPASDGPAGSTPNLPQIADTVTLTRTGGLAGVSDTWTISPEGAWTAADRTGNSRSGQLTVEQRAELTAALNDPALAAELAKGTGAKCADSFVYTLSMPSGQYVIPDCSGARPAFGKLVVLIKKYTS